jgi:formate-dependent nitrite reductase membrane component NrfD
MPGETIIERRPFPVETDPSPQAPQQAPAYYDISMLKPPVWESDVAVYFFLGGLSAGAYLLARSAERFGGERYRRLTQVGTVVAALAAAPCAPLLIIDLGDPKRFLNMLRVFKPRSPMNLGAWTLTAYTGASVLALLREWLRGDRTPDERSMAANILDGALVTVCDAAGAPLALLLATYTGVLLSATSTPVWSKNPWLGAMFAASAVNTGSAAISLALDVYDAATGAERDDEAHEALQRIDTAAHAAEALTLTGFHASAGSLAEPLTTGKASLTFWGGAAAMTAAEVLKLLPLRGKSKRYADAAAAVCGLAGGFALRWSLIQAGPLSANDPDAARQASRPRSRG